MLILATALIIAVAATAADEAAPAAIERAQTLIAQKLKDPEAARFRGVRFNPDTGIACGQVNMKNGFGGYVGYQDFIVRDDFALTRGEAAASLQPLFDEAWRQCHVAPAVPEPAA
ncbi:hypothetical protein [Stenotrophomonas pigmentata]|uniref:hypothetical protein n=1 Tax=Stenotrophomonas pigmentata TaxID=3055080 RepID=UPI0026ED26CF|nr:hypothetical protein [Stenotrophomonas sp. 610A2]